MVEQAVIIVIKKITGIAGQLVSDKRVRGHFFKTSLAQVVKQFPSPGQACGPQVGQAVPVVVTPANVQPILSLPERCTRACLDKCAVTFIAVQQQRRAAGNDEARRHHHVQIPVVVIVRPGGPKGIDPSPQAGLPGHVYEAPAPLKPSPSIIRGYFQVTLRAKFLTPLLRQGRTAVSPSQSRPYSLVLWRSTSL